MKTIIILILVMSSLVYGEDALVYETNIDNNDLYTNDVLNVYIDNFTKQITVITKDIWIDNNISLMFLSTDKGLFTSVYIRIYIDIEVNRKENYNLEDGYALSVKFDNGSIQKYMHRKGDTEEENNNGVISFMSILMKNMDYPLI